MWFYLYILASKKRVRSDCLKGSESVLEMLKNESCVRLCVRAGIPNFAEKWYMEWARNWPSCTYSRGCANDCVKRGLRSSLKLDEAWTATLASRQKKMIEQNVRKEIQEGKTQNNQGTKLLVVWIWSDGTNDERARGVYWRINQA